MSSVGGLYVTGNSTAFIAPYTATKYTTGWAAFGNQHGNLTVEESATNSRLTLKPGKYLVTFSASVETDVVSGTSGDSVGIVTFAVYKDQAAVTGLAQKVDAQAADRPASVAICGLVEVEATDSGQVEVFVSSGDSSGVWTWPTACTSARSSSTTSATIRRRNGYPLKPLSAGSSRQK